MILTRKHVSRRSLLRGVGAALALPMLDAMVPALGAAAKVTRKPRRIAWLLLRAERHRYAELAAGRDWPGLSVYPKILQPLAPVQDEFVSLPVCRTTTVKRSVTVLGITRGQQPVS